MDIPEKFPEVIRDFLSDLSVAFPEYVYLWESWTQPGADITPLYQYCLTMYPERFFDILYQNEDIFGVESESNTMFLPHVEFKMLFSVQGISDNTKQAMWKYLQLILITIMGNIKTSASFGDTAGMFEGIEEEELQKKLAETVSGLTDFFKGLSKDGSDVDMEKAFEDMFTGTAGTEGTAEEGTGEEGHKGTMPDADDLHNHIKSLFDGKIGTLAKELAEEMSGDVMSMFDDGTEAKDTTDVLKKMMKNPKKIMDLVKKIGIKLDDKMKSGSISQAELMKEAGEMMTKMKGMGNGKEFQDMMKGMMKGMGGKGAFDMNKMNSMMGQNATKERMRAKMEQRKAANYTLEPTAPNEFIFKMPEEGLQEKSKAPVTSFNDAPVTSLNDAPVTSFNDDWLADIQSSVSKNTGGKGGKKKKAGKKK
jgi:hypothetical protein